jgi:predicted DNA-binding transcriptional regulator AlpA
MMGEHKKQKPPSPHAPNTDYLRGMDEIIPFTGISRSTFYRKGYDKLLKNSRYIFHRRGRHGRTIWWSYKNLILVWLTENFQQLDTPAPDAPKETAPENQGGD